MYRPRKKMRLWDSQPPSLDNTHLPGTSVVEEEPHLNAEIFENEAEFGHTNRDVKDVNVEVEAFSLPELGLPAAARQEPPNWTASPRHPEQPGDTTPRSDKSAQPHSPWDIDQVATTDWQDSGRETPAASSVDVRSDDDTETQHLTIYKMTETEDWSSSSSDKIDNAQLNYDSDDASHPFPAAYFPEKTDEAFVTSSHVKTYHGAEENLGDAISPSEWDSQLASLLLFFRNSDDINLIKCYGMVLTSW